MELDNRKLQILSAIIKQYIEVGEPVGSKTISNIIDIHVSSATIRNDMASLFDMGFLEQPYTSAGRVPSHLGYRYYIDNLMECEPLTDDLKSEIASLFNVMNPDPDRLLEDCAHALAKYTGCATISTTITPKDVYVKKIELIPATDKTVVILLIASNGAIRNKVCRVNFSVTKKLCDFFTDFANGRFGNKTLSQITTWYIKSVAVSLGEYSAIFNPLIAAIYELCQEINDGQFYINGEANLLGYDELQKTVTDILLLLSKKDEVLEIIPHRNKNVTVTIGKENSKDELKGSSVLISKYNIGQSGYGVLALIGPVRLDYSKVIPHLEYFSKMLGELLTDTLENNK